MSFSFNFVTESADRANALTAAQTPPEPVAAFIAAAGAAIGALPSGWLLSVSASGHLDMPAAAAGTPLAPGSTPPMPMAQTATISVSVLQVTE